ncbi:MAG: nucleoside triphosphate pyrophosphohydrolase [Actinomycetota bacterium]|nr:nucleoside triphosphate pyrophosphohydrolase [Actinomycetota bacterium]
MEDIDKEKSQKNQNKDSPTGDFEELVGIMKRLRSKESGCPWDLEQTPETLAHHLLEEAYETVDSINRKDWGHLKEELGDLLLQIVFQAAIAEERNLFDIRDVIRMISEKLIRRHPHIFGDEKAETAEEVAVKWDRIKREEKAEESMVRMPGGIPALLAAIRIQGQAASAGFDWEDIGGVFGKVNEELEELKCALQGSEGSIEDEVGDLFFAVVNAARHLGIDPEISLMRTCREFVERWEEMESLVRKAGLDICSLTIEEKEEMWQTVKRKRDRGDDCHV